MTAMTSDVLGLPRGRALTRDDLDAMPDDGHRYELIDGILIVSPAPRRVHQRAVMRLGVLLFEACPDDAELLPAPFDVVLADDTVIQPDLLVAPDADYTDRDLPVAPMLAIEVLSPSTRGIDLLLKKDRLLRAGCAHYWVVDPDEPSTLRGPWSTEPTRSRRGHPGTTRSPLPNRSRSRRRPTIWCTDRVRSVAVAGLHVVGVHQAVAGTLLLIDQAADAVGHHRGGDQREHRGQHQHADVDGRCRGGLPNR